MVKNILVVMVLIVGIGAFAFRLWPVFAGQPWLSEFFVTEDGYLMLTIARNMATGLGMTVSEGTIATNGVQPMATFLFSAIYWLAGGDKVGGLVGVSLISVLWSVAGFFAVRAWARHTLTPRLPDPVWSWAVAALWFSGPLLLRHTMNALETGLYTLFVLLALLAFLHMMRQGDQVKTAGRLGFGLLCGLVFMARNDGAFLVVAIFISWAIFELYVQRRSIAAVIGRLVPAGLLSLVVASPWLIYNKVYFGSIVPISGAAQQLRVGFAHNLPLLPGVLFEHAFPMLPIPGSLEGNVIITAICVIVLLVILAVYLAEVLQMEPATRFALFAYGLFLLMLCGYYGLHFGAPHFLSRYLAPAAPLLMTASVSALVVLFQRIMPQRAVLAVAVCAVGGLVLSSALLVRQLTPGVHQQGHFQVVRWVHDNVTQDDWVGAVQTGTLGYWHDRTVNLDGKVNPEALAARRQDGHALNYVVGSQINHIVDWYGMHGWMERPGTDFADYFELVVADPETDLTVMSRRDLR